MYYLHIHAVNQSIRYTDTYHEWETSRSFVERGKDYSELISGNEELNLILIPL